jgi:hypothetical protein
MFVMGLDIGYSNLKVVMAESGAPPTVLLQPAGAAPADRLPEALGREEAGLRVLVDGEPWAAGVPPGKFALWNRALHQDYARSPSYRALFHAALLLSGQDRVDRVVTGLPVSRWLDRVHREAVAKDLTGIHRIGAAIDEMLEALDGRRYVENYVATLTHEIKTPLSTIRAGAELLETPMPAARRAWFLTNLREQSDRIQELIERLLELAALEKRHELTRCQPLDLAGLVREAADSLALDAAIREVRLEIRVPPARVVEGDRFLLLARPDQPDPERRGVLARRRRDRHHAERIPPPLWPHGARPGSGHSRLCRKAGVRAVFFPCPAPATGKRARASASVSCRKSRISITAGWNWPTIRRAAPSPACSCARPDFAPDSRVFTKPSKFLHKLQEPRMPGAFRLYGSVG